MSDDERGVWAHTLKQGPLTVLTPQTFVKAMQGLSAVDLDKYQIRGINFETVTAPLETKPPVDIRDQVLKPFRGEENCDADLEKANLAMAKAPTPPYDTFNNERMEQSKREIRAWISRNFKEYPTCRQGGNITLKYGRNADLKRGDHVVAYFSCNRC